MQRQILLQLNANIDNYEILLFDGCSCVRERITSRRAQVCVYTNAPFLRMIARSLTSGYNNKFFFGLDTACQDIFCFSLTFSPTVTPTPPTTVNTFTLTDSTYNLPIDGTLFFKSVKV